MARVFKDWLPAYLEYASVTEAPRLMHFWGGVSALAACLRRKVWLDFKRYQWFPSFYIIYVAKPGIVAKSTTADIAMDLVKAVPGIKFGPDVITWQALVTAFSEAHEAFQYGDDWYPMSALTLLASELGNLINPQDREQMTLYINLWDGRKTLDKQTKTSGNDLVEAPWINLLGCTTPHWIADNMPAAAVGGGFTSRCVFVYADRKERLVAYVDEQVSASDDKHRAALIHDLEHIATTLCGPFNLCEDARVWGRTWYEELWEEASKSFAEDWIDGYVARKQTHLHKLAMVLAVSRADDLVIVRDDLIFADKVLKQTEVGFQHVFSRIGKNENIMQVERLVEYLRRRGKPVAYKEAYLAIHSHFPNFRDFEGILNGLIRSGQVKLMQEAGEVYLAITGGVR